MKKYIYNNIEVALLSELYTTLNIKFREKAWFTHYCNKLKLIENVDYFKFNTINTSNKRIRIYNKHDIYLTLNTAKLIYNARVKNQHKYNKQ